MESATIALALNKALNALDEAATATRAEQTTRKEALGALVDRSAQVQLVQIIKGTRHFGCRYSRELSQYVFDVKRTAGDFFMARARNRRECCRVADALQ